jgi:hypothetical protein
MLIVCKADFLYKFYSTFISRQYDEKIFTVAPARITMKEKNYHPIFRNDLQPISNVG